MKSANFSIIPIIEIDTIFESEKYSVIHFVI